MDLQIQINLLRERIERLEQQADARSASDRAVVSALEFKGQVYKLNNIDDLYQLQRILNNLG